MTQNRGIKTELNRITQDLRRTILEIKQQSVEAYLQTLMDDASTDYSLWKSTKSLERPTVHIPPLRKHGLTWERNNKEKAEAFADYLERTFERNKEKTNDDDRRFNRYLR
jgi:hypothetical protein